MKSSTRLDSALFQLTPTRTRYDLVISANGKTEKIASGLLNPFLSHLKTAQEQMAKGGYSIILEPESGSDATWFTKSTVERFVRFVSTPEVLERVYTLESEILQIEEAIAIQGNNDMGLNPVEENHGKPVDSIEGNRPMLDGNEEKAIVLYQPDASQPEANGSTAQGGNSKVQLLKVLETRKTMLQKEQGMAFARAVAAGFDIDHLPPLISFAECFGASRLMDACRRYKELWKRKHETGQWLEIEAAETVATRSEFSPMNASGIMLSSVTNKQNEVAWENNGKSTSEEKLPVDHQQPLSHQEYFPGQFPHQMFPPWPVHSSPGALPVYPPYPMQGMPYYQNYPGNSPFFQPPYPTVEDPRLNQGQRMKQKRHSMDSANGNLESETLETDGLRTRSSDDAELENESLKSRESRKKGSRSGKKQSGTVVIRNINYITSKGKNSSDSESQSTIDSQTDEEGGSFQGGIPDMKVISSRKSSKRNGNHKQSIDRFNSSEKEEMVSMKEGDEGNWQAFQNFLLRDPDEDRRDLDQGMFSMEKKGQLKRRQNTLGDDPLISGGLQRGEIQEGSKTDINKYSGNVTRLQKSSNDALLISAREDQLGHSRSIDGQMDLRSTEIDGRRGGYRRNANDDFMIHRRDSQSGFTTSPSDPLAVNGFDRATYSMDRRSSNNVDDDSYIVPFRSISLNHVENNDRNAIDMGSEFPSAVQKAENMAQVNYEPDELTLMPERGAEKGSIGYDPALDYEMQVHAKEGASLDKKQKEVVSDNKQGSKKADKDRKSKLVSDISDKKIGGPIRKGKTSKLSPLDEARARAEKLRSFKADLQKMKKEKEEEEMKRLEALKIQRQKRIAARGGGIPAQSPLPSQQTRKQGLTKLSPSTHKGSKFSDSDPGSSSPLQRVPIKTPSMGSADSHKTSKSSKLNSGIHSAGNRLSRSASSLPEKNDNVGVTSDAKPSMARIRRLSEPKVTNSHHVSSVKPRSMVTVSKPKVSDGPESKKISAIVNYDKSKAATLPELKIRTSKGPDVDQSTSTTRGTTQKDNSLKSTSEGAQLKRNDDKISHHNDGDDNTVIEKTVVMLEKPSIPIVHTSEESLWDEKGHNIREKTEVVSEYAAIRAPVYPPTIATIDREPTNDLLKQQVQSHEAARSNMEKEPEIFSSNSTVEKPYQVPYVRVSSLEDLCTHNSEYGKAPPTSLETGATGTVTMKALVSDSSNLKLEKIPEAIERPQVKESSKGFRRLLKFGRKNHGSSSGERNVESDNVSTNGSEVDDNGINTVSSSEVFTLKNLISQDETPNSGATLKSSRHFSLLSPFRSKTSEKKLATS
ncbi:PREDICTED: COP1-interacting [Prunus dulcis]|uniref:PREDICTED: COP1-interacting n=1 Tax=Prunus dulcis TaxID=3755 RepID=A0A5E4EMF6_PRUDU|nr:COP1-interacting protein 7 [Prunus dulcis]VVA16109.1 PREDICTED: COP1-interacting [Prunus dulcis]